MDKGAWEKLPNKIVLKFFKKCCINNELIGTEDDELFSDCEDFPNMDTDKHKIQITYRMFTPIGANGKLLTLNFHIDTGAATSSQNN